MTNRCQTISQLKSVIEYIIWNYSENVTNIDDKEPVVIVQDLSNIFIVQILYICEIRKGDSEIDPTISIEDEPRFTKLEFNLLKGESFRQLTKYVEDICEEIANIKIDV